MSVKTSLIIDDRLYKEAQRVAREHNTSLSEAINEWARLGLQVLKEKKQRSKRRQLKTVQLGGPSLIDLSCRRDWMDSLDV